MMYNQIKDLKNLKFGRLTVIEDTNKRKYHLVVWKCLCDCGKEVESTSTNLLRGDVRSCGCLHKDFLNSGYADYKHGLSNTSEHRAWMAAKGRCDNPRNKGYKNWGGRGIRFCDRWRGRDGFKNFLNDVGEKPEPKHLYSIDRIDVNGNYEPGNVRWATDKQQMNNRRLKRIENFTDTEIKNEFIKRGLSA